MQYYNADCLEKLKEIEENSIDSIVTDPPAGISFMGKEWDSNKGGSKEWIAWMTQVMQECLRVLKPGGHALVWAIPRTSHWTATAIEDAGFEVRDVITHLFGSGFPKSHNISKAIDKKLGVKGEEYIREDFAKRSNKTDQRKSQVICGQKGVYNKPASDQAKQWDGWGTALKPASEHWILCRKPFKGSVVDNVLKHGTGGLNIDISRIETTENITNHSRSKEASKSKGKYGDSKEQKTHKTEGQKQGRFPSNLLLSHHPECDDTCHDDCAVKMLDDDSGGASRFFKRFKYQAKASKKERNEGLEGIVKEKQGARPNSKDNTGKFPDHDHRPTGGNNHPTVKPIALMEYLITMITPPNGTVLDPFMGSGSTGVAAAQAGYVFIGIERHKEYFEIANKRIGHHLYAGLM